MKELYTTLKEAALNNNCPKCYSTEGLHITFKQKHIKSTWFNRRTDEISSQLFCKTCNQHIYPVDWNEDIERVYEYHRKASPAKPKYFKPSRNLWLAIGFIVVVVGTILVYSLMTQV